MEMDPTMGAENVDSQRENSTRAKALVECAESGNVQAPRCRRLCRRATDEHTDRAIQDHFKGWSSMAADVKRVAGCTLRERISKDKIRRRGGELLVGGE